MGAPRRSTQGLGELTGRVALPRAVDVVERGRDAGLHLGAQLAVTHRGRPVADLAFGESRPGEAMTPETIMLWLSSTKPVGAIAIAQLWERGRLRLDDRVSTHLPEFAAGGKESITIRHLLTHTAGFRTLRFGWPEASWDEIVATLCATELEPGWIPGEKAGYHTQSSWFVLGELVRRIDGRSFDRYVREAIFLPLGLDRCWVGMDAEAYERLEPELGRFFDTATEPPTAHRWHDERAVVGCSPGGNGHGPMGQLVRLYAALLDDGGGLLRPQTVEALAARHRVGLWDHTFQAAMDWGLGLVPNSRGDDGSNDDEPAYPYGRWASRRAFGHSGYRSSTAFADPEHGLAVAAVFNGTPSDAAHRRRMNALLEAIYLDLGLARANGDR